MHLFNVLKKIINSNLLGKRRIYINSLFLIKKNSDRRNIYLDENNTLSSIKITDEEVDTIKRIINNSSCRRFVIFIPASTKHYFALIDNQKQVEEYLWMSFDLFYYSKTNHYYVIRNKKDKEWMKYFLERYDKIIENRESHSF